MKEDGMWNGVDLEPWLWKVLSVNVRCQGLWGVEEDDSKSNSEAVQEV